MRIKDWPKFQHFTDRRPPWIKLYRNLLDDDEWYRLPPASAKILVLLWLLASEDETKQGLLPCAEKIAFRLRIKEKSLLSIVSTLSHWVLQDDIDAMTARHQLVPSETETETETETEICPVVTGPHITNGRNYRDEAKTILGFLNEKTGRKYRAVEVNLGFIEARLKSGVELQDCKTLIARKVRDWLPDPKMAGYLRPETLFNKTKFETYLAEVTT